MQTFSNFLIKFLKLSPNVFKESTLRDNFGRLWNFFCDFKGLIKICNLCFCEMKNVFLLSKVDSNTINS